MYKIKQSEDGIVSMRNYLLIKKCEAVIQQCISLAGTYEEVEECFLRALDKVQYRMRWDLLSHLNSKEIPQLEKRSVPNLSVIES